KAEVASSRVAGPAGMPRSISGNQTKDCASRQSDCALHKALLTRPVEETAVQRQTISRSPRTMGARLQPARSSLPSVIIPCPHCLGRIVFRTIRMVDVDIQDLVYACE